MISVVINVCNSEKYIRKCLDSIVNQTYKDLEILIINDGSTDKTIDIVNSYKDKRIKVITKKCKNISLCRNVGLDNAKGEFIYYIDSDDYMELDTLEYLYNLINKYDTDIATCRCIDVYNYDFKVKNKKEKIKILDQEDYLKMVLLSTNREVAIWNKLIRREVVGDLRFYDKVITDILYTYRLALKCNRIVYSNQIKYYYLNRNSSYSHSRNDNIDRVVNMYNAYLERYEDVYKKYPNMMENRLSVLWLIHRRFLSNNKDVIKFLKDNKVRDKFNELFSIKVFKCDINFREKMKVLLFRISPKLYKNIINIYLKMKGKIK